MAKYNMPYGGTQTRRPTPHAGAPGAPPPILRALLVGAAAVAGLAPAAAPTTAQTVTGHVVDAATTDALGAVLVELVDGRDAVARSGLSADDGRFTMTAPRPGLFRLRAQRIGHATTTSEPVWLSVGDTTVVQLHLATAAVDLPPLLVLATRRHIEPVLERTRFYDREDLYGVKMSAGTFFGPEDIAESAARRTTDLLREVSGIRVVHTGGRGVHVQTRWRDPIPIYIDGVHVKPRGETIDQLIPWGSVGAIEVYHMSSPAEFGGGPAIAIWTRYWPRR